MAQIGAALAGFRVIVGAVKSLIRALIVPFRMLAASAEAARVAYANSLRGGMPLGYSIKTSMLASALGVGQGEVMMFGRQVEILNEKMKYSMAIFKETNKPLTMVGWNMKALAASLNSVWAMIAKNLAPSINQFLEIMRDYFDSLAVGGILESVSKVANAILHFVNIIIGLNLIIIQAFNLTSQAIADGVRYFIRQVKNSIARLTGGDIDSSDQFVGTKAKAALLAKTASDLFKRRDGGRDDAPNPVAGMQRLAASAWEKMGLVLGSGGANHAQQTAANTKRIASLMERMVGVLTRPGEDIKNEYNYSRP
jgi:hypothetical protein